MKRVLECLAVSVVFGCGAPEWVDECSDHGDGDDVIQGHNAGHALQGLAQAGRWVPPPDVMAAGDAQDVEYTGAPPYDGGSNCSGGATPGASMLRTHLLEFFPAVGSIGVYNCRVISGTNTMSLHGVGRALDIMIPTVGGDADNDLGDPIAHWLIENAEAIGIQTIIWDHTIWRVSYSPREHELNSSNPHVDHLHVELSEEGAQKLTSWYTAPFGPTLVVPYEGCALLGADGGVLEEDGPCFELHGPAQFWRTELGVGSGGSLLWTNAFDSTTPSNTADWKLAVSRSTAYRVAVYLDPEHAQFPWTRYELHQGDETTLLAVDQSVANGWHELGTFDLDASVLNTLHVYDHRDGEVGESRRIVVDAVRVVAVVSTGDGDSGPDATDGGASTAPGDTADEGDEPPAEPEEPADEDGPVLDADTHVEVEGAESARPSVRRVVLVAPLEVTGGCSAAPGEPVAALLALLGFGALRPRRRSAARN